VTALFTRITLTRAALCVGAFFLHGGSALMASSHLIYFGTYTRATSRGIYAARLDDDTGALSAPELVAETLNPTWVVLSPDKKFLYTIHASKAQAIGYKVDGATGKLTPLPLPANANEATNAPSHLAVDATGRVLIASNYGAGYVASMAIKPDGTLGVPTITPHTGHGPNPQRQDKPHPHSATFSPDNRFVIVCDLGLDKIFTYAIDPGTAKLTPASPPFVEVQACSGPRHFKFSNDGRHAYCITEMGATIDAFDYNATNGALTPIQMISTLPADYQAKWGAEVRVHPNGKFLYGSNRGHGSIAVFAIEAGTGKLTLVETVPTGSKVPRNFALSPNGKWLVCGHQDTDKITVFRVDATTGKLTPTANGASIAACICVQFYD
jgi:6-phosphogluconolactonase